MTAEPVPQTTASSPVRFWQVIVGQLPWVVAMLSLGAWYASKQDSRIAALETWRGLVESQQRQDTSQKIGDMQRTIEQQTEEIARLRTAVNKSR